MCKKELVDDKPIYVGTAILDLRTLTMLMFHCNIIQTNFGNTTWSIRTLIHWYIRSNMTTSTNGPNTTNSTLICHSLDFQQYTFKCCAPRTTSWFVASSMIHAASSEKQPSVQGARTFVCEEERRPTWRGNPTRGSPANTGRPSSSWSSSSSHCFQPGIAKHQNKQKAEHNNKSR